MIPDLADTPPNRSFARVFDVPIVVGLAEHLDGVLTEYASGLGWIAMDFEGGPHGNYYQYLPQTDDGSDQIILEKENYGNANRWRFINYDGLTADQQDALTVAGARAPASRCGPGRAARAGPRR